MADLRRCARWRRVAASVVWRYIALVRRANPLWALERFEQANDDVETILSTTDCPCGIGLREHAIQARYVHLHIPNQGKWAM